MAFITAETRSDLIALSVGMLKQAPSNALLEELIALSVDGGTLADAADHIAKTAAFKAEYPSFQTAAQYAAEIFDNITTGGTVTAEIRTAVIDLATGYLTSGAYSKAGLALAIVDFLSQPAALLNSDFADIAQSVQNRSAAAEYFVVTKELGGSTDAELAAAVASVTSDAATLTAANAAADTTAAAVAVVPGQTFTLTTALDNKTLGAGNDQAFAVNSDATAASDTFNVVDKVDGGAGEDTFFLTINDITGAQSYTPSRITNFEKLSITNVDGTDQVTVDANLMGLTSVENAASNAAVVVSNVTAGATLAASGSSAATTLTVKGAGLTGTEDTATIALTGNTGAVTYQSDSAQDIEKAAITVTGANTSALTIQDSGTNAGVTSVTVSGSGSYDMETGGNIDDLLTTLDASANTGGVTFTSTVTTATALTGGAGNDVLTGAAGNDVIKGGAGDDTLAMGSAGLDHIDGGAGNDVVTVTGLTEDDSIVGGDGVDTLVISAAIAYDDEATPTPIDDAANISGFEVLRGTAALSQDMAALSGIVALQSTGGVLTATEASDIADFFAFGLTDVAGAGLDITLATDGAADSLNIHVGLDAAQTKATSVTVDAIEIETALINSVGKDGNIISDFEADALTSLTVIGSKTLSVTLNDSAAVATIPLTKVDASAFTGDSLTITAVEADSGVTVTTGSEALSVTVGDGANNITGTAGADTITTGSGADTIVSYAGDDTIEAGDGANTITVTDGENDIDGGEGVDTITAGDGNNTIDGGDGADVIVAGKGNNTITNSAGNATITAGNGNNNVTNTAGNSTITLGNGTNVVNLTAGNSTVVTGSGADDINITAGNNNITAGAGNDSISLGSGNDTVDAGTGTDAVDFSVARGTWTGAITGAETVTATYTGSATIDAAGIAGYTTLNITASGNTAATTLKNIGSATINLSDDSVEGGGDGDIEAMTIDTTDDAAITVNLGANQEASTAAAADLASLAITDAASVTLKASGGSFGNLLSHDFETVTLDDDETTSVTLTTADYTSSEANIAGSESVATLSVDAAGVESDMALDAFADPTALQTLTLNADGLNSSITLGGNGSTVAAVGDAEGTAVLAILSSVSITASNGATIDANGGFDSDAENADINTQGDLTSLTISASGEGSVVEAPTLFADGDLVDTISYSATNGARVDTDSDEAVMNYGFESLVLETSGAASTLEAELVMDEGAITASAEATISISAQGAGSVIDTEEGVFGAVDLDSLTVSVGSLASLTATGQTDVEVDDDIGTIDINLDANATFEGVLDIDAAGIITTLDVNMQDETEFAEAGDQFSVDVAGGSDSEVGIKTLNVVMATEADTVVDSTSTNLITIGGATHVEVGDSEGAANSDVDFYQGSIQISGDNEHTVNVSNVLDAAELDTAGTEGTFGSWTITTGEGNDTITGSDGADTITSNDGGDNITAGAGNDNVTSGDGADSVLGGTGNDTLTVGNGADTVGGGAGVDSIVLTESVSSADVVEFSVDAEASSDSSQVTETGGLGKGDDTGQDTITTFTAGVDTIKVTATDVESFTHGTDTDLGTGSATGGISDDVTSFATNVGLINFDGETADEFGDAGDLIINFASPTTTMTEALFEAALQYNVTGTATADTITGGALADTITGGDGADSLTGGAGVDTFVFDATAAGNDADTISDFSFGEGGDAIDITAYLTTFDEATDLVSGTDVEADSDVTVENDHLYFIDFGDNEISAKAFDGADFGDIFAESSYITTDTVDAEFVVIVQGDDVTKIYYGTNDGAGAIDADDITLVGTLSSATATFDAADNFI